MDQIYPDESLIETLRNAIGLGLEYRLFVNDLVPDLDTSLLDFEEASWNGYEMKTVLAADFIFELLDSHVGQITSAFINFPNASGGDQLVFGFYATFVGGNTVVTCGRFDHAPLTIPDGAGQQVLPGIANYSALQV